MERKGAGLVGSFNNWDKVKNPMKADADGLTWRLALPLAPGRYLYKFAPFDTEEQPWIVDPNAPRDETDKENENSLLWIVEQPFVYKAEQKLKNVSLVGSFNNWNNKANPMVADADGLTWRLSLSLSPGRYVYKFAPFGADGEQVWVVDPNVPRDETDKENENSLVIVAAPAEKTAKAGDVNHEFVYKADKKLESVRVVGSFNNWDKNANPLKVDADGLTWRLNLPLAVGKYVYKFVLLGPGENWVVDPNAPLDETDKVNENSVLLVNPVGYDVPASPTDGIMAKSALFHPHGTRDLSYDNGKLALILRARPNDLSQIAVQSAGQNYPAKLVDKDDFYAYYSAKIPWNRKADLSYQFALTDGKRTEKFGANGLTNNAQPFVISAQKFQPYLLTGATEPLKMKGPLTTQTVAGPAWAKNLPIYEVNLDKYNFAKGTALREYEKYLPVLKEMGVGIVWFMPLHPRGFKKGYGSPYAVRDFRDINPDFGSKDDFRHLVKHAHELGLHVLMDWVGNHSAWDNPLIEAHPEFYVKNPQGEIIQAGEWPDVAQLDFGKAGAWNQPLWNLMRDDMAYWVREFEIDGFRVDVAGRGGQIPVEFWNWLRPQLDKIKPVFMLAEADDAYLHPAFDMTFSWNLPPVLWDITARRKPATAIDDQLRQEARNYPIGAIRMRFLDNHDWHDHADWGWGNGPAIETKAGMPQVAPLMVLCATLPGKPMIYNGQEMSFSKTEPSPQAANLSKSPVWPFYQQLFQLYQSQPAFVEGSFAKIPSNRDDKIYAFLRQHEQQRALVIVNLSDQVQTATLRDATLAGNYRDWFGKRDVQLGASPSVKLAPWAYNVYLSRAK